MSSTAGEQIAARVLPPRRGACIALAVDATARVYALGSLALGGFTPDAAGSKRAEVYVTLQAVTADVWLYFAPATHTPDLDPADVIAAGGTLAFDNAQGFRIPVDGAIQVVLDRTLDKFMVCRTSSGTATLLAYASSESV
jgi:hypothetical protein